MNTSLARFIPRTRQSMLGWLAILVTLFSVVRIVLSYHELSQTWDEPDHLACGMQLLDRGVYDYEDLHPPVARLAIAFFPYLDGARSHNDASMWQEGNDILYGQGHYWRTLTLARLGILPFYLLCAWILWIWTKKLYGAEAACFAILCFTLLPPVLAHAALATTDFPVTAMLLTASYAFWRWLQRPDWKRSIVLGCVIGIGVATKFTFIVFFPCSAIIIAGLELIQKKKLGGIKNVLASLCIALLACCLTIWAFYGFSTGPLQGADQHLGLGIATPNTAKGAAYPAPAFFDGISTVLLKNSEGHAIYFMGKPQHGKGSVWYFPVAIALKTPIAFLLLALLGAALIFKKNGLNESSLNYSPPKEGGAGGGYSTSKRPSPNPLLLKEGTFLVNSFKAREFLKSPGMLPFLISLLLLAVVLPSNINIGLRHILPIYPFLAILAALGARWLFSLHKAYGQVAFASLFAWMAVSSLSTGNDHLTYFNEFAGSNPERYLIASDLDWGQDLHKLSDTLRANNVRFVSVFYNGSDDLVRAGLPNFEGLRPFQPPNANWVAISKEPLYAFDGYGWLQQEQPYTKIGNSILLYNFTNGDLARIRSKLGVSEVANLENIAARQPSPVNFLNLSLAYYNAKRYEDCIAAAKKAIALKPDYAAAYNNICAAYNSLGNFAEGKKAAEEALHIEPDNQLAKNNLAWSTRELEKNKKP